MKRNVPLLISFFGGFVLILAYFSPWMGELGELAAIHFDILAAIAFILGGGNLLRTHGEKIYKQQSGWAYSAIAVTTFLATLYVGVAKVGVTPQPGFWTGDAMRDGDTFALASIDIQITGDTAERTLSVQIRRAEGESLPVRIGETLVGEVQLNERGRGLFTLAEGDAENGAALLAAGPGTVIRVGERLSAPLIAFGPVTGQYNSNGSAFWWFYQYGYVPLQQTTFAMLAFYVASAAFRAFRAKNVESVLLLGTAFIILTGRTFLGTWLTGWLPDEGLGSFFQIPNLVVWFMSVFNTAGQRAIIIGIALGVASTSLKVLLGIDRSYLGKEG